MNRLLAICAIVLSCALLALGAAFTPGNILITRSGTGTSAPSANTNSLFIDEYTKTGSFVQTITLSCIVRGGTGTNGGILEAGAQLSADGTILAVPCYSGTAGTNVANSAARYVYTLDSTGAATLTSMSLNGRTLYSALAYSSTV